jgi:hypothetical protein
VLLPAKKREAMINLYEQYAAFEHDLQRTLRVDGGIFEHLL